VTEPDGLSTGAQRSPDGADNRALPPLAGSAGRGRELSRRRARRAALPETGRRHHIGAAPQQLVVRREDGSVDLTWTAPIQLADQTDAQLVALAERIESEMSLAAADLDFERAAHLREEAAAATRGGDRPVVGWTWRPGQIACASSPASSLPYKESW